MRTPKEKRRINHVVTDMINMTVQYFRRIMSTSPVVGTTTNKGYIVSDEEMIAIKK